MITLMSLVLAECGTHFYILVIIQISYQYLDGNFEKWKNEKRSTSKQIKKLIDLIILQTKIQNLY